MAFWTAERLILGMEEIPPTIGLHVKRHIKNSKIIILNLKLLFWGDDATSECVITAHSLQRQDRHIGPNCRNDTRSAFDSCYDYIAKSNSRPN